MSDNTTDDGATVHNGHGPAVELGQELRRLREARGMSLARLAASIHYTKGYLSRVETGHKPLSAAMAASCDEVLDTGGVLTGLVEASLPEQRRRGPHTECPYRGLAAYSAQDARWFFGRERATTTLVRLLTQRLEDPGPVMVVAESGSGKSSLLQAGLVPALRRGVLAVPGAHRWPVVTVRPGGRPVRELLRVLAGVIGEPVAHLEEALDAGPDELTRVVGKRIVAGEPDRRERGQVRLVLMVDQFEEMFTLCHDEAERALFVRALHALSTVPLPHGPSGGMCTTGGREASAAVLLVVGMRADFYGTCLTYPELAAALRDGQLPLEPMRADEVREAVCRPAEAACLELEPGLVELILRDLGAVTAGDRTQDEGRGCEPGSLPLLSHALLATWQERRGEVLAVEGYRRAGGIAGAVAATAERAHARLPADRRAAARAVLLRLVRVDEDGRATRRHATREELVHGTGGAAAAEVVEEFTRARLLTSNDGTVTLAHEAVLRAWPRLREWIEADAVALRAWQQLAATARQWAAEGHDPAFLPRGNRLNAVREAAEHPLAVVGETERAFLAAAEAQESAELEQERRRSRRLRRLIVALAVLLVLALISTGVAVQEGRKAVAGHREATLKGLLAERNTPAVAASSEASLLLAAAAWGMARTPDSAGAVLSSQADPYVGRLIGHRSRVRAVAWSWEQNGEGDFGGRKDRSRRSDRSDQGDRHDQGDRTDQDGRNVLLSGGWDGKVRVWDASTRRRLRSIPDTAPIRALATARGSDRIVWGNDTGHVSMIENLRDRHPVRLPGVHGPQYRITGLAMSDDGRTVLSVAEDGLVDVVRDAGTHEAHSRHLPLGVPLLAVAVAPDGRRAAVAGKKGRLWLLDLTTMTTRPLDNTSAEQIWALTFTPGGDRLISGDWNGNVVLWNARSGKREGHLNGLKDSVLDLSVSPDNRYLAAAGHEDTATVWDLATGRQLTTLRSHHGFVNAVDWSADGRTLATGGDDGTVRLWTPLDSLGVLDRSAPWTDAALSPDGRLLGLAGKDGTVRLADPRRRTARILGTFDGEARAVAFSHDGTHIAAGDENGRVKVWRTAGPQARPVNEWRGHREPITSISFRPGDRRTLATASEDYRVGLWELREREGGRPTELPALIGHDDGVFRVLFLDRDTLVTGALDTEVRVWRFHDARPILRLTEHRDNIRGLAVSRRGLLATASRDDSVKLWERPYGKVPARTLNGHRGPVVSAAFNPSGTRLVTTGDDHTVNIWDVATGRLELSLTGHRAPVSAAYFLGNDGPVLSVAEDGNVLRWNLDADTVFPRLCRKVGGVGPRAWELALRGVPYRPGCP